ncbi:MAG: arginine--tRNA ligase [Candidatus Eremiobacteraeota bacterium]|nr:arginine--tRNA ligase [Candidatus Eremiobacteraeota bacterium]
MNPITTDAQRLPQDVLQLFGAALASAIASRFPDAPTAEIAFEAPRRPEFGDFSTNAAFSLARIAKRSPQDVAAMLIDDLAGHHPHLQTAFAQITATAGFINLRLAPAAWQAALAQMLTDGTNFGQAAPNGTRISLEFGSANPTGPLVVVQGRTLSIGATLASAMRFCGYDVFTEWISNDAGSQLETLGASLYARYRQLVDPAHPFPENGYPGDYLLPIAAQIAAADGELWCERPQSEWMPHFSTVGKDALIADQRKTVERFGVTFDLWQSEKQLHDDGRLAAGLQHLADTGTTYRKDGALFFRATQFGDDKDRVLVRADGRPTYLAPDVAYHYDKLKRSDRVIDILGPDHHGYIGRLQGLAEALGYKGHLEVLIAQQITLMRSSEQVAMSKRAGHIVTLDEIIDEVGVDAARFFFVMLAPESPLTFDLALAKTKTHDNPVYYVQYGHARIASVFKNAGPDDTAIASAATAVSLRGLTNPAELALIRRLAELPKAAANAVEHLAPHRLTRYARDVAADFHQFYTECKILTEDRELRIARLALASATKNILAQVLALVGVSAPDAM